MPAANDDDSNTNVRYDVIHCYHGYHAVDIPGTKRSSLHSRGKVHNLIHVDYVRTQNQFSVV